jgi:DNA-binding helix-hairpin-helix protein with protein kinase domain
MGELRGFLMRRVNGVTLVPITALALMKRRLPHWGAAHVCRVVHDVAAICAALEARRVVIGDVNLANFLADPVTAETSAIDCDSYQVTEGDQTFPCRVFTPDFQAPEVLARNERLSALAPAQFRFSGALLFFTLLTAGGHPYQIKNGRSPAENIVAGRHFLGGRGTATGATTGAIWSRYLAQPPRILALFKRAFIAGHSRDLSARPSFAEWVGAFRAHYTELIRAA